MSDTLTALQTALAPKTGMRRIPMPLESYEHASLPLSAKRLVNMYAEQEPSDARVAAALIPSPGLVVDTVVGSGPIKAINSDLPGYNYVVSGTRAYRVRPQFGAPTIVEDLGDVGVPTIPNTTVTVAVGVISAVVCVPPNAFTCGHAPTDVLNQLGGTFPPGGATSVAYMDGYFAFSDAVETVKWFISGLFDPTNFDALDFAYSDALPNAIVRVVGHKGEFWMMGNSGHEVWYDAGNQDFPFRRRPSAVIRKGVAAASSIAMGDGSMWWVSPDNVVYRSNGYNAVRVSTHAIERIIEATAGGAFAATHGYVYEQNGHTFYSVTFGNRTILYDTATQVWHERSSSADGSGPWRIGCAPSYPNYGVLGDSLSGKLFVPVLGEPHEDGVLVLRVATLPPLWGGTRRAFCSRVEIEGQPLFDSTPADAVLLQWSDDGGMTWGPQRALTLGPGTETRKRFYTTRLGSFRQRVFRILVLNWMTIYAIDADITAGTS